MKENDKLRRQVQEKQVELEYQEMKRNVARSKEKKETGQVYLFPTPMPILLDYDVEEKVPSRLIKKIGEKLKQIGGGDLNLLEN